MEEKTLKTALITGASGGLGRETSNLLLKAGYRVIALDIDSEPLLKNMNQNNLFFRQMDVSDPVGMKLVEEEFRLEQYGLDLLICLAGIYESFPVTEASPEKFMKMMAVNTFSIQIAVNGLLKALITAQGRVIVVSSESYRFQSMFQPYMITKAALEAYCRSARQELALKGVKLSVVRPGAIDTPLLRWMDSSGFVDQYTVFRNELLSAWKKSLSMVGHRSAPSRVAALILKAASSRKPRRIYRINNNPLLKFLNHMPEGLIDRIIIMIIRNESGR